MASVIKRSNVNVGPRAAILAELKETGMDRLEQGNQVKATEYKRAHDAIKAGEDMVRVRHAVWIVSADDSPCDGEDADAAIYAAMTTAG